MILALSPLRWIALVVVSSGAGALAYGMLCLPSRPALRLGVRGLKRQRALDDGTWRTFEPLVRWLGVRLSGILSDGAHASLDRQLVMAGDPLGLDPSEYVALSLLGGVVGAALGLLLSQLVKIGTLLVITGAFLGLLMPYLSVSGEAERRLKAIRRGIPGAIDLIALGMSAGLDFPGAIRQVVEKAGDAFDPLVEELGWILHKLDLGHTRRQTLEAFAERAPVEVVLEFVGAVVQGEERGHPIAEVLEVQAATSRQRRSVRAEESAAKAGVALTGPMILLFLSILLLIMGPIVLKLAQSGLFSS